MNGFELLSAVLLLALGCAETPPARDQSAPVVPNAPKTALGAAGADEPAADPAALGTKTQLLRVGTAWKVQRAPLLAELAPLSQAELTRTAKVPWQAGPPAGGSTQVLAAVDTRAPRPLAPPFELGRAIPEDEELAPGLHTLFLYVVDPPKRTIVFDAGSFALDVPRPGSASLVACGLFEPKGTYNGPRAREGLPVTIVRVDQNVSQEEVRVTGEPGVSVALSLGLGEMAELVPDESGDYRLTVLCLDSTGTPLGVVERVVTVNLDLDAEP